MIQSYPQVFNIQLVGGPDDGCVFALTDLPIFWEMISEHYCDQCLKIGIHTPIDSERYWHSNSMTPSGHHVYYHEGSLNLKALPQ